MTHILLLPENDRQAAILQSLLYLHTDSFLKSSKEFIN